MQLNDKKIHFTFEESRRTPDGLATCILSMCRTWWCPQTHLFIVFHRYLTHCINVVCWNLDKKINSDFKKRKCIKRTIKKTNLGDQKYIDWDGQPLTCFRNTISLIHSCRTYGKTIRSIPGYTFRDFESPGSRIDPEELGEITSDGVQNLGVVIGINGAWLQWRRIDKHRRTELIPEGN